MNVAGFRPENFVGRRFGRLVVISAAGRCRHGKQRWSVRCDCGAPDRVVLQASLTNGKCNSCGCYRREVMRAAATTHGMYETREYVARRHMLDRCMNPLNDHYDRYGGRGISVCDRWRESFENFIADMGLAPSAKHEIERIDNDGNYEPTNCRWATEKEQARNKSTTRWVTLNGKTQSLIAWVEEMGLKYGTVRARIRNGWSDEQALTTPVRAA